MKPGSKIVTIFLTLIAIVHLIRIVFGTEIIVSGTSVPLWMSFVALLVTSALAIWLWREGRNR
jgi:membrane protein implicated in regulation of membrane protease activity